MTMWESFKYDISTKHHNSSISTVHINKLTKSVPDWYQIMNHIKYST